MTETYTHTTAVVCEQCQQTFSIEKVLLMAAPVYRERVVPGMEAPAGECPDCGGLCYRPEAESTVMRLRQAAFTMENVLYRIQAELSHGPVNLQARLKDIGDALAKYQEVKWSAVREACYEAL